MPTIIRFANSAIAMYFDDHNPPHFHILGPDFTAMVHIETLEIMKSNATNAQLKDALEWAAENRDTLRAAWAKYSAK